MPGRVEASLPGSADVAIVGGGVNGIAAAHELARDHDVVLVERGKLASEASALAAGEITVATKFHGDEAPLADHALQFFRTLADTGGFHYEERRSVELVPEGHGDDAEPYTAALADLGHDVEYLPAAALAERYPRVNVDGFDGGIEFRGTGFLDPYTYATTLADAASDRGATIVTETTVTGLQVDGGAVTGVQTDRGTLHADHVVVAAGWRTGEFLADHVELPVRPYRTQCIVLDPEDPVGEDFPMGWLPGEHVYFRPELNGDVLVGGWSFACDDPENASSQADEEFRHHVAEVLPRILRGGDRAGVVNGWAGIDGATPDTFPIVDAPDAAPDGLVVSTGFHGRGVMLSPIAGTLVGDIVRGDDPSLPHPFRLERFEDTSPDFEFTSISSGGAHYEL
jgi:glycine/D-amino acid oxidase-like deaminating enzyme